MGVTINSVVRPINREEISITPTGAEASLVTLIPAELEGILQDHVEVQPLYLGPVSNQDPVLRESQLEEGTCSLPLALFPGNTNAELVKVC